MDANKLWISVKNKLKGEFTSVHYDIYIEPCIPIAINNNIFYIKGQDKRTKEFYEKEESKKIILDIFGELAANISDIIVIIDEKDELEIINNINGKNSSQKQSYNSNIDNYDPIKFVNSVEKANLNPKYTFETFVAGPSNNIAMAACQRVANYDNISNDNPLFLYGGVGLGKTHLMHAIGHRILERDPSKKVLYVSSETYTNEFITSLGQKNTGNFRAKYRNVDILMVDDIQFFAKTDSVQEELFHTFNDLHNAGKKIILSSDRVPQDIPKLEERLKSRFVWGITIDIQPPDYSTRMAVLQMKSESENIQIPKEVFEYIADNVKSNIRELEGALNKVILYADLSGKKEIDLQLAKEALKDSLVSYTTNEVNVLRIKETVADAFNVSVEDIDSKKRDKKYAFPRQIAMYIAREIMDISLPAIGEEFGNRDHSTVIHAIKKINDEIEKSETTKIKIEKIKSDLIG
ncbi:chromosomal replication initiator protein DnaA [Peptostreptococcus sp. D1]|uniref:chromosomal replication initiator protein DnaA n=1 Tax=Peptostreptococcus sp. D1 TaxID=72304 RepID=UPI0008ED3181|nr:chromosomal replication initiator protein DnaA [Peptostreptococcus sp. D1]SFE67541.1 chromosomal replication initiator protein [Peptostreptococcus sp. D1]